MTRPEGLRELLELDLTDEQLAAATAPLEPGVIMAGAGSGKTTVMAARVVWLVATGQVLPEQVLGLTFTNKAAAELAARLRGALARLPGQPAGDPDGQPTVATYHAYAGRLLREHGLRIGVEPRATLLADATRFQLAERVLRRAAGPFVELDTTVATLVGDVVALDGELNEHLVDPERLRAFDLSLLGLLGELPRQYDVTRKAAQAARKRGELTTVVQALRVEKVERGVLDFGDQLAWATRLATTHPAVGAAERDRFRVVLLDEYQDTSVAQRVLLTSLFADGPGHPVTAVGDPCQAIYGWRGASIGNIDDFPRHFRRSDGSPASRFTLRQNNRSGGLLLSLANSLSAELRERHDDLPALVPRPGVEAEGSIRCALFLTSLDEAAWIADEVGRLVDDGVATPRDIAVLVRVRTDFAPLHAALTARGLPVEVVGLGGLLELPEVAELVAMLEVLDEPTANPSLLRLLSGPRWRVGPRDLALLGRRAGDLVRVRDGSGSDPEAVVDAQEAAERALEDAVAGVDPVEVVSLAEALERPGGLAYSAEARTRFAVLAAELRGLRAHVGEPLLDLVRRVLATTGLEVEARRTDGLLAFLDHAASFADLDGDPSLRAFLAYLRAADLFERGLDTSAPSPADSVKLMTVHKAKGLEWPVVAVPDLTEGVFPSSRGRSRWTQNAATLPTPLRGDTDDFPAVAEWSNKGVTAHRQATKELDLTEERRLAYVAVTRAKTHLIASGHWWGPTQRRPRGPSSFLEEIRAHCANGHGEVVHWEPEPPEERNPALEAAATYAWPAPLDPVALVGRREGADLVRRALTKVGSKHGDQLDLVPAEAALADDPDVDLERVAGWDRDVASLLAEAADAHRTVRDVLLPLSLSASAVVRLVADPAGLARDLARPMPRPPAPAATRGTRFHAWVEAQFGVQPLIDRTDLEGAADEGLPDAELAELQAAFLAGPYASRPPLRVEAPFQLVLAGRVVRGRIDAVYAVEGGGYDVVDWKTGRQAADPLQLAIYRTAWAELAGVAEADVGAAFYYVGTGKVVRPDLPSGDELAALLS